MPFSCTCLYFESSPPFLSFHDFVLSSAPQKLISVLSVFSTAATDGSEGIFLHLIKLSATSTQEGCAHLGGGKSMFSFTGGALEGMQVDAASKQEASGGQKHCQISLILMFWLKVYFQISNKVWTLFSSYTFFFHCLVSLCLIIFSLLQAHMAPESVPHKYRSHTILPLSTLLTIYHTQRQRCKPAPKLTYAEVGGQPLLARPYFILFPPKW